MPGSSAPPERSSTSPRRITRGNAAPMRTPTASCANTCPSARAWPTSPNTIAIGSRRNSTAAHGSGSAFGPRRNAIKDDAQCCTSKLISDRSAPDKDLWITGGREQLTILDLTKPALLVRQKHADTLSRVVLQANTYSIGLLGAARGNRANVVAKTGG